ncbi:MAG: methyl-accepting chemotaxis protein, partial [Spirochaetales bacterium]|nr:methyl-accepting chemotaxis protein [Spirochaetales bacterium]
MKKISLKILIPVVTATVLAYLFLVLSTSTMVSKTLNETFTEIFEYAIYKLHSEVDIETIFYSKLKKTHIESERARLSTLTDLGESILQNYYIKENEGVLSRRAAQEQAKAELRALRFGDNGYFWATDKECMTLILPNNPENEGEDWTNKKDEKGNPFIKKSIQGAMNEPSNGIFISYWWPKKANGMSFEKLSHARYFSPWGWVIGCGYYLDEVQKKLDDFETAQIEELNKKLYSKLLFGSYPYIVNGDSTVIAYYDQDKIGKKSDFRDSITGDDFIKELIEIKNGSTNYNYKDAVTGKIVSKRAYVNHVEDFDWYIILTMNEQNILDIVNAVSQSIIVTAVISIIVILILLIYSVSSVTRAVNKMTYMIHDISEGEGDLTKMVDVTSKDELGSMAEYFNNFIESLRNTISSIKGVSDKSGRLGHNLASSSEEISATVEEIAATMRSIGG